MKPFCNINNISQLSEKKLIARVCQNYGDSAILPSPFGAGDDCALIKSKSLKDNVYITSDAVIMGRHFTEDTSPRRVASKLFKRNISDIASMGAYPTYAITSSICSGNLSLDWLDEFAKGLGEVANEYNIKIIGGDFASVKTDFFSMHLTLLGESNLPTLTRSGANIGDYICVTGALGASFESEYHLDFKPRVEEGLYFANIKAITSCTDISDGIASDIKNILPDHSFAQLYDSLIALRTYNNKIATIKQALCDGEDYELLFTFDSNIADFETFKSEYEAKFSTQIYRIGEIKKANHSYEQNALFVSIKNENQLVTDNGFDHYNP